MNDDSACNALVNAYKSIKEDSNSSKHLHLCWYTCGLAARLLVNNALQIRKQNVGQLLKSLAKIKQLKIVGMLVHVGAFDIRHRYAIKKFIVPLEGYFIFGNVWEYSMFFQFWFFQRFGKICLLTLSAHRPVFSYSSHVFEAVYEQCLPVKQT